MLKSMNLIRLGSAKLRTKAVEEEGDLEQIQELRYVTPGARSV